MTPVRTVSESYSRDNPRVAAVAHLDPGAVTGAVRALLLKETDRVDNPRVIPEDRSGWHAMKPIAENASGFPHYRPESWRWFDLIDVGYVDEMALIVFRWTDPTTPELRYSFLAHADGLANADAAATVVRGQLRRLLEPGWRDRVEKRWISNDQVLIWRAPKSAVGPDALTPPCRSSPATRRREMERIPSHSLTPATTHRPGRRTCGRQRQSLAPEPSSGTSKLTE